MAGATCLHVAPGGKQVLCGSLGAASPRSAEGWNTGSLFDLVIVGGRALRLLPGCGWSELATEVDAPSSPGVLGMFPSKYFFLRGETKIILPAAALKKLGRKHL